KEQGNGPFFNGSKYSLVDASYAPFLQRYFYLDRIRPLGYIEKFPRLKAWAEALVARPSTHSFPEGEFETMYRLNLKKRNKYLAQFVQLPAVAAEGCAGWFSGRSPPPSSASDQSGWVMCPRR